MRHYELGMMPTDMPRTIRQGISTVFNFIKRSLTCNALYSPYCLQKFKARVPQTITPMMFSHAHSSLKALAVLDIILSQSTIW